MEWMRVAMSRLTAVFRRRRLENELDDEVRLHLELATEENRARGLSEQEARTEALRAFGGVTQTKERYRVGRGLPGVEAVGRDARYAARQLMRRPGFTATVVVTLALAIGANTAIFSVVNALMLRSLPYGHPERMGTIFVHEKGGADERQWIDGRQWEQLRDNVPSVIPAVAGVLATGANLRAGDRTEYVRAARVSAHYLDVLGLRPGLGRNFSEEEDRPGGPSATILSYRIWKRVFGGDRGLLGQSILLKGQTTTVVGVLAEGASTPFDADVYTAIKPDKTGEGGGTNYEVITRLRDGATWQEADAEINRAWVPLVTARDRNAQVRYYSVPMQQGETTELRPKALTLMVAAGCILLIACANLAGLMLVRVLQRRPEMATRLALGASHWQIQRQLWVESLMLALAGGLAGLATGQVALRGLMALLPEGFLPVPTVPMDGRVLGFTAGAALLTSVLFGVLPGLFVRRTGLRGAMNTRTTAGGERLRLRQTLIAGEVALTVVLLAGSGLLIRTLVHLETLPPGFNPQGVMTAKASLDDARYTKRAAFLELMERSTAAMRQIPGVEDAAVGLTLPFERALNNGVSFHAGAYAGKRETSGAVYVTPGYFKTLQIPLLAGREITEDDRSTTQPVAVVNESFAHTFFQGMNPVGQTVDTGITIVGVVGDVKVAPGLDAGAPLTSEVTMYIPATQMEEQGLGIVHVWFQPSWVVRTAGPVQGLTVQMQRAMASVDPGLPFSGFYSMDDLLAKSLADQRVEVALLGTMAGLALLLSAVGIFALVASIVGQRTREISIRIALGSTIRAAMVEVGAAGTYAAAAGLVLGLGLCGFALRAMRSVLYGVGVYDKTTLAGVAATLTAMALVATAIPVLRVARIDPVRTLREE